MINRLTALLFVILSGFGVWFYRTYMEISSQEMQAFLRDQQSGMETLTATKIVASTYKHGTLDSVLSADEAFHVHNGAFQFDGNVRLSSYDNQGRAQILLNADKATGQFILPEGGASLLENTGRVRYIDIPGRVKGKLAGDDFLTQNVRVDFAKNAIDTHDDVLVTGPDQRLKGTGFHFFMDSGDFRLDGPVRGVTTPDSLRGMKFPKRGGP